MRFINVQLIDMMKYIYGHFPLVFNYVSPQLFSPQQSYNTKS